jgi:hypothetical protein
MRIEMIYRINMGCIAGLYQGVFIEDGAEAVGVTAPTIPAAM